MCERQVGRVVIGALWARVEGGGIVVGTEREGGFALRESELRVKGCYMIDYCEVGVVRGGD